jgi:hypothetical protein
MAFEQALMMVRVTPTTDSITNPDATARSTIRQAMIHGLDPSARIRDTFATRIYVAIQKAFITSSQSLPLSVPQGAGGGLFTVVVLLTMR